MAGGNDVFTKSLLHFEGNFTDVNFANTGVAWTAVGSIAANGAAKFGTASLNVLNSTSSGSQPTPTQWLYVPTPVPGPLILSTGDWTIDFWMNNQTLNFGATPCYCIGTQAADLSTVAWYFDLRGGNGTTFSLTFSALPSSGAGVNITASGLSSNAYHHIAVVSSLIAGVRTVTFYVDGVSKGSAALADVKTVNGVLGLGYVYQTAQSGVVGFRGQIDEFRISNGVARWTANFTPPSVLYGAEYSGSNAVGAFTYVGKAIPRAIRTIFHATGSFTLTGKIATLLYGKIILIAASGAYNAILQATLGSKNGRPILILAAEAGQYIKSGFTNYILRVIKSLGLGDPPSLQKTRRNPPTLDM